MGLTLKVRKVIAKRWADGDSAVAITKDMGRSPGTICAEPTQGRTGNLTAYAAFVWYWWS